MLTDMTKCMQVRSLEAARSYGSASPGIASSGKVLRTSSLDTRCRFNEEDRTLAIFGERRNVTKDKNIRVRPPNTTTSAPSSTMSSAPRSRTTPSVPNDSSTDTPLAAAAPQLSPTPWISFAGGATDSAAPFVQSVQRVAFLQGRIKDDEWIAEYASTSFTDSALEWYVGLEEETRSSWKKLRAALVQRYPVEPPKPVPPPTPAQPTAAPPAITDTGRIEVIRPEFGDFFGYLSQDSTGRCVVDPRPENALKLKAVLHTKAKHQHQNIYSLRMLNASGTKFAFLGLQLVKFPEEDPDTIPEIKPSRYQHMKDVPSCCKPLKDFPVNAQSARHIRHGNLFRLRKVNRGRTI